MQQLKNGDLFPDLSGETVSHGLTTLPSDIAAGRYAVVIGYRAHW